MPRPLRRQAKKGRQTWEETMRGRSAISRVAARRLRRCSLTARPPASPGVTLVLGLDRGRVMKRETSPKLTRTVQLNDINLGQRHRKDLGDIDALAESIRVLSLLHPIVVTTDNHLVAGRRRLEAVRKRPWNRCRCRSTRRRPHRWTRNYRGFSRVVAATPRCWATSCRSC